MDRLDRIKELVEKKTKEKEIAYKLASLEEKEREEILAQVEREDPELAGRLRKGIEEANTFTRITKKSMITILFVFGLAIVVNVLVGLLIYGMITEKISDSFVVPAVFFMIITAIFIAAVPISYLSLKEGPKFAEKLDKLANRLLKD